MTILASINPVHLNTDEYPWVTPEGNRRSQTWFDTSVFEATMDASFAPRPEFAAVTTHPHSQILQAFRDSRQPDAAAWAADLANGWLEWLPAAERAHATRVLIRLAAVQA